MKKIWTRYTQFMEGNYLSTYSNQPKDISYWRTKIFMRFMMFMFPIGVLIYIPSMIMSVISELPVVAIIDTLTLLVVTFLVLSNKIKLQIKKYILVACFYALSVILLVFIGSIGPGLIYLLGTSIFLVLIVDTKAGYISIFINIAIYLLLALGLLIPNVDILFFNNYTLGSWIAVGGNFLLINTVIVVSISSLINGLQQTVLNEKELQIKLIEEGLKLKEAKDKAIQSDKLKSAFLANMSHEIRTPLNAIVGFSKMLLKREDPEKQKLYVDMINKSTEQLLYLINDIIDLSKIEAGVITIHQEKIRLVDFYNSIVGPMSNLCPDNLEFRHNLLNTYCEQEIVVDIQKVTQIITNLITNSYKYTKEGYVLLNVELSENNQHINFTVKDTGIGIEKNNQKRVFERFYQENDFGKGVGLGLSICNSLVKAMNGKISFESEFGKGTTFYVSIQNNLDKAQNFDIDKDKSNSPMA